MRWQPASATLASPSAIFAFLSGLYVAQTLVAGSTEHLRRAHRRSSSRARAIPLGRGAERGPWRGRPRSEERSLSAGWPVSVWRRISELGLALFGGPLALDRRGSGGVGLAAVLLRRIGFGNTLVDVSANHAASARPLRTRSSRARSAHSSRSCLQRSGIGAMVAPLLVTCLGTKGALVAAGVAAARRRDRARGRGYARSTAASPLRRGRRSFGVCRCLRLLPEPQLERLAAGVGGGSCSRPATWSFAKATPGDRFYVIEEGEVEIAGKTFGPGESFGEIALLRDVPTHGDVAARTDVVLRADRVARTSSTRSPRTSRRRRLRTPSISTRLAAAPG